MILLILKMEKLDLNLIILKNVAVIILSYSNKLDSLFSNAISCEEISVFDIPANTESNIFICSYNGLHVFNIGFKQTGVNGPDAVIFNVNSKEFTRLTNNGVSDTKYLFTPVIVNLKMGDIITLRTSLSRIQSDGAYSTVVVYGL